MKKTAKPGIITWFECNIIFGTPIEIIVPHETSAKISPNPRKVNPASANIPPAIPKVPTTITGDNTFGMICLVMILKLDRSKSYGNWK